MRKLLLLKLLFFLILPLAKGQKRKKETAVVASTGAASFYADNLHGRRTSNGERYDRNALTAAHMTLPFGSKVRVINPKNGKSVIVRINDRGPHRPNRVLDLSKAAAKRLGFEPFGCPQVCMEMVEDPRWDTTQPQENLLAIGEAKEEGTYSSEGESANPEGYGLQVSAYHNLEYAASQVEAIQQAGFDEVFLQVTRVTSQAGKAGAALYRVMVGEYKSRASALEYKKKLLQAGFAAIPVKHI